MNNIPRHNPSKDYFFLGGGRGGKKVNKVFQPQQLLNPLLHLFQCLHVVVVVVLHLHLPESHFCPASPGFLIGERNSFPPSFNTLILFQKAVIGMANNDQQNYLELKADLLIIPSHPILPSFLLKIFYTKQALVISIIPSVAQQSLKQEQKKRTSNQISVSLRDLNKGWEDENYSACLN